MAARYVFRARACVQCRHVVCVVGRVTSECCDHKALRSLCGGVGSDPRVTKRTPPAQTRTVNPHFVRPGVITVETHRGFISAATKLWKIR